LIFNQRKMYVKNDGTDIENKDRNKTETLSVYYTDFIIIVIFL